MEKKKLLLVAISVGVFFVIAIGAALVAFKPAGALASAAQPKVSGTSYLSPGEPPARAESVAAVTPAAEASLTAPGADAGASTYLKEGVPGLQSAPENTAASLEAAAVPQPAADLADSSARTLITVNPKPAAGVPSAPVISRSLPVAAARPARTKPAAAPRPASKPAAKPSAAPVPVKTRDDYWVQTGAFTAISRAEGVKQTLAEKGITSIIENRSVDGTTYFRVRIGPYTSENEADYWLSLIKSINGFEDSQIRKSQTRL